MFFRRRKPVPPTFEEQLNSARELGFTVESLGPGRAKLSKYGSTAVVEAGAGQLRFLEAGIVIDGTVAELCTLCSLHIAFARVDCRGSATAQGLWQPARRRFAAP